MLCSFGTTKMYTTEPPVAGALQAQVAIPVKPVTLKQLFLEPAMDATPDRMSHCSELSDSALRCSFEAAYAELDGAEAPPSADMVAELESGLLPVCGLESHERGIVLLRKSLAAGRDEQDWMPTQMSSPSPRWGGQDDWQHMRPCLLKHLLPTSAALPHDLVIIPATYFRDPHFQTPNAEEDCVLVSGGVSNTFHEGATGGGQRGCYRSLAELCGVQHWLLGGARHNHHPQQAQQP